MKITHIESAAVLRNLASVGWMAEQPEAFKARMAKLGRWMSIKRGNVLYNVGDEADAVFGLGEGLLDIAVPVDTDHQVVIHRATAGFWIGDSALLAGSMRTITVSAASAGKLFKLPAAALLRNLEDHPEDWISFYRLSHMNVTQSLYALGEMLALPPRVRFARALLRLNSSHDVVHVTQEELGRMVGMSRAAFRRAFAALIDQGIVGVEYGCIRILNPSALKEEAARTAR